MLLQKRFEHGGGKCVLKMSTVRYASVLAIFTIFCVNILTKSDKRFIISLQVNIGIFRNTASRVISREAQRNGVKIPDAETAL